MYNIKLSNTELLAVQGALAMYKASIINAGLHDSPIMGRMIDKIEKGITEQQAEQSESVEAFERAIAAGILSNDKDAPNYAGHYMYMGIFVNDEYTYRMDFKHRMTREYLRANI